jgi:dCTP deaminase
MSTPERILSRPLSYFKYPPDSAIPFNSGVLSDNIIRALSAGPLPMIDPFEEYQERPGVISYGLSSAGYDVRVRPKFHLFKRPGALTSGLSAPDDDVIHTRATAEKQYGHVVDPKRPMPPHVYDVIEGDLILPPNSFALAESVEYMRIPSDVICCTLGKSTYARTGVIVNMTPLEPGWEGTITIEFANLTPLPVVIYGGEGALQILFLQLAEPCQTDYREKRGKYNRQSGIRHAVVN